MNMARGLIEGALGGLARAAGNIAQGHIQNEQRVDLQRELSAIEEQRQMRIMEAQERTRRTGRQADFEQDLGNAPARNQAEVERIKTVGPATTAQEVARTGEVTAAKGAAERKEQAAFGADKAAQAGVRAEAAARDVGAGERGLRMKALQGELADKETVRGLLKEAAALKASGDVERAKRLEEQVRTLQGLTAKDTKSYADVIAGARVLEAAAKELELTDPDEAAKYRQRAADLIESVSEKRGVKPAGGGKRTPYAEGTELTGPGGELFIVRNGRPEPKNKRSGRTSGPVYGSPEYENERLEQALHGARGTPSMAPPFNPERFRSRPSN